MHTVPVIVRDPNTVTLKGSSMISGHTYNITGSASLGGSATIRSSSSVSIYVDFSPLVATITPPGTRTIGMNDAVILDGSASIDPDKSGTMNYTWSCNLSAGDGGGACPEQVRELLSNTSNAVVHLQGGTLSPSKSYDFYLFVQVVGTDRKSPAISATLEVQDGDPPDIGLIGPTSVFPNANEAMVIEAEVSSCCKGPSFDCAEYTIDWISDMATSKPTSLAALFEASSSKFLSNPSTAVDTQVNTGMRKYKIILAPGTLVPGGKYSFALKVTDKCGFSGATLPVIQMNAPPSGGTVLVSPEDGFALDTLFEFSAPGWSDPEALAGLDSSLTYSFLYLKNSEDEASGLVTLKTQTDVITYETVLGEGPGEGGTLKVAVSVADEDGGSAMSMWKVITVKKAIISENVTEQAAQFDKLFSDNVESASNRSNPQELFATATMIGDLLSSGNIDPEVVAKQKKKLVEMAISAAQSGIVEKDTKAVEQQATFLGTMGGGDDVDEETQDAMLSMVDNLAAASEELGEISHETTTALSGFLGEALAGAYGIVDTENRRRLRLRRLSAGGAGDDHPDDNETTIDPALVTKIQSVFSTVETLMSAVAIAKIPGEKVSEVSNDKFVGTLENASPRSYASKNLSTSNGISLQPSMEVFQGTKTSSVQSLVVEFKDVPQLDDANPSLAANGIRILFKGNGSTLAVQNLSKPIDITIPVSGISSLDVETPSENETVRVACLYGNESLVIENCTAPRFVFNCTNDTIGYVDIKCPQLVPLYTCVYWDTVNQTWATGGVTISNENGNSGGTVTCHSVHLTDFSVKIGTAFSEAQNILAAPFAREVNSPEELLELLAENIVIITAMGVLLGVFVLACCMSRKFDADDNVTSKLHKEKRIKNIWASSRGIVSAELLHDDVTKTKWTKLWWGGLRVYHPVLSIWYTHSGLVSRPQRVMILMIVLSTNMFFDALFWQMRAPDGGTPDLGEVFFIGIIGAAMNIPAIMVFERLYRILGARVQTYEKHVMLGRHHYKSNPAIAQKHLGRIRSIEKAQEHLYIVRGAIAYLQHSIRKIKQPAASLMCCCGGKAKRAAKSSSLGMQTSDLEASLKAMRAQEIVADALLTKLRKQDKQALDMRMERFKMKTRRDLLVGRGRKSHVSISKEDTDDRNGSSTCCISLRLWWFARVERARILRVRKMLKLSKNEAKIHKIVKQQNCLLRRLYRMNRRLRNPGIRVAPSPHWVLWLLDAFGCLLVLFYAYFIVSFGFYFGQPVAVAWLRVFVLATACDLLLVGPLTILAKTVFLPRLIAYHVFSHPQLRGMAATPLMSGAVGVLGPTGQAALALGIVSAGVAGVVGKGAAKWLSRARKKEPENSKAQGRVCDAAEDSAATGIQADADVKKPSKYAHVKESRLAIGGSRYAVVPALRPRYERSSSSSSSIHASIHADANELKQSVVARKERLHINAAARRVLALKAETRVCLEISEASILQMVMHLIEHQAHHEILQHHTQKAPIIVDEISPKRVRAHSIHRRSVSDIHEILAAQEDSPTATHAVQAHGLTRVYSGVRDLKRETKMIAEMKAQAQSDNKRSWKNILSSPEGTVAGDPLARAAAAAARSAEAASAAAATLAAAKAHHQQHRPKNGETGHL